MIQPDPPIIGERQISNHECVPASLACALQSCGRSEQVQDIVGWLTAQGFDTSSGVTIEHAASYIASLGLAYEWDDGNVPMSSYVPAALAAGYPVIGFHQCDGNADPVPAGTSGAVEHCRRFYGNDAGAYQTMNPWPPNLESTSAATMQAADVQVHLTINLPVTGGADLTPDEHNALMTILAATQSKTGSGRSVSFDFASQQHALFVADLDDGVQGYKRGQLVHHWYDFTLHSWSQEIWAGTYFNDPLIDWELEGQQAHVRATADAPIDGSGETRNHWFWTIGQTAPTWSMDHQ